jgi:hypothetical protein
VRARVRVVCTGASEEKLAAFADLLLGEREFLLQRDAGLFRDEAAVVPAVDCSVFTIATKKQSVSVGTPLSRTHTTHTHTHNTHDRERTISAIKPEEELAQTQLLLPEVLHVLHHRTRLATREQAKRVALNTHLGGLGGGLVALSGGRRGCGHERLELLNAPHPMVPRPIGPARFVCVSNVSDNH